MSERARSTPAQKAADRLTNRTSSKKGFETRPIYAGRSFEVGTERRLEPAEGLGLQRAPRVLPVFCVECGCAMLFGTGVAPYGGR